MGAVWLICCERSNYAQLLDTVMNRDVMARTAYVEDPEKFLDFIGVLAPTVSELAVCVAQQDTETLELMVLESASSGATHIVVLLTRDDVALMARLLQDGATEVMAELSRRIPAQQTVVNSKKPPYGAENMVGAGMPPSDHDAQLSSGAASAAPWTQANLKRYLADLDEPDIIAALSDESVVVPSETASQEPTNLRSIWDDESNARQQLLQEQCVPPATQPIVHSSPTHSHTAPIVCALAGRGGCGRTTLIAALAQAMSAGGLRTAVLDLDLMFGKLWTYFGADRSRDISQLADAFTRGSLTEDDLIKASLRVAPGLTLWGPTELPERAELVGAMVEQLLGILRKESDIVLVDTSTYWSDSVAAAVSHADRCLMVSDRRAGGTASAQRVIDLTTRIGVPRTRMTTVFMGEDGREEQEDAASRFEFSCALSSKIRIADAGPGLGDMAEFGHFLNHMTHAGTFQQSVRKAAIQLARELGCAINESALTPPASEVSTGRIRLPWKQVRSDAL